MTAESLEQTDKATGEAGVGKMFAGGTARGTAAPFPGQSSMATERVLLDPGREAQSESASGSGGGGQS